MLEYFSYKKLKKHKAEKEAAAHKDEKEATEEQLHPAGSSEAKGSGKHQKPDKLHSKDDHSKDGSGSEQPPLSPVLDRDDESWLRSILGDDSPPPSLPPRVKTPEIEISSDSDAASGHLAVDAEDNEKEKGLKGDEKKKKKDKKEKGKEKGKGDDEEKKDEKHHHRISAIFTRHKKRGDTLKPDDVPEKEAEREKNDLANVLNRLNLSAKNNKAISLSEDSAELLQKFTQVFKDLVNGVPTAVNDLTSLVEDRDGTLNRGFEKLPSSLQKLVTQLPDKLTSSLAPELLAAAAESQGLKHEAGVGVKDTAKKLLMPQNLTELVTKPGAIVSMLKAIVNALKLRWPAFIGTNVIWSVSLFLLMFVLWYCHKRGREVRLERENSETQAPIDGSERIEELPDDPQLPSSKPAPVTGSGSRDVDSAVPVEAAVPR